MNNIGADALINFAKRHYGERYCDYKIECYKFHIIKHIYKVYKDFQGEELPDHVPVELSEVSVNQNGMDIENTHEKYILNKKNFVENISQSKNRNIRTPNGVVGTINHLPPNVIGSSNHPNEISKKITNDISSRIGHTYDKIRGYLGNLGKSFHNIPLRIGFGHNNSTLAQNLNNNKNVTISYNSNAHVVPLKSNINKIVRIPIGHKNDELERKNKQLQDEVNSLKTKVSSIDKNEVVMEKTVNKKIEEMQQELEAEKRIIDNTQKREIVAALIGGTIIGLTIVALLFVCSCYRKYK